MNAPGTRSPPKADGPAAVVSRMEGFGVDPTIYLDTELSEAQRSQGPPDRAE
jgi:hypothetical protein